MIGLLGRLWDKISSFVLFVLSFFFFFFFDLSKMPVMR